MRDVFNIPDDFNSDKPLILVVEDNEDFRSILYDIFSENYQILEAENGMEGIKKALEYKPELIITDYLMPVIDGMEMCRKLKENTQTSHIPLLMLSSVVSNELKMKSLQIGVDEYIDKAFNIESLKYKVQGILR